MKVAKRICTICARGGSKGVKNKNIRELLGKPLIAHTILQAQAANCFDAIAVTSDSDAILEVAKQYGVTYLVKRPAEMATDEASKLPGIMHCVQEVEAQTGINFDYVVDLDGTSPLRDVADIHACIELCESKNVMNVITAAPARRSPYFNLVELTPEGVAVLSKPPTKPILRRQDSPQCFDMNASIYVWQKWALFEHKKTFLADTALYVMPPERSIDIDSELDFQFVEFLYRQKGASLT